MYQPCLLDEQICLLVHHMLYCTLTDREFDPEKHCGVVSAETGQRCTRSLTCKVSLLNILLIILSLSFLDYFTLFFSHRKVLLEVY